MLVGYHDRGAQFLRVDNVSSKTLDITTGVRQISLWEQLMVCIFVTETPAVVKFDYLFMFADDFRLLAHGNFETDVESDFEKVARWLKKKQCGDDP